MENVITEKEAIRKALCLPKSFPESCLMPLQPVGITKFKGDKMPDIMSVNDQFEKGKIYPVYDYEGLFVIGKDGIGKKIVSSAWSKINFIID